jgi:uncharacterized protein YndB with AHSA1/START domain
LYGLFSEIDRPHRLTFSVSEHGPGGPSFDSEVEVTFDQRDGRTYLTYVQLFQTRPFAMPIVAGSPRLSTT